jgi:hypothetical protein
MVSRWVPLYMRCAGIVVLFVIVERGSTSFWDALALREFALGVVCRWRAVTCRPEING